MSPFENEASATAVAQEPEVPASTESAAAEAGSLGEPFGTSETVPSVETATDAEIAENTAAEEVDLSKAEVFEPSEPVGETLGGDVDGTTEPAGEVVEQSGPPTRIMAAGTKLQLGSTTVTLTEDATFTYDEADNEQHFAATCQMTGNYEVNAPLLAEKYDANGRVIEG